MDPNLEIRLSQLLETTFTANNLAQRQRGEAELASLQTNVQAYFEGLLRVIFSESASEQVKSAAAINMRRFVKEKQDAGVVSEAQRVHMALEVFKAIQASANEPIRSALGYAIVPLLDIERPVPSNAVLEALTPAVEAALEAGQVISVCKVMKAAFSGFGKHPMLYGMYSRLQSALESATRKVLASFKTSPSLELAETLSELCNTQGNILEHFDLTEKHQLKEIKDNARLAEVFQEVLMTYATEPALGAPNFFCVSNSPALTLLNGAKTYVLQATNLLLEFLTENRRVLLEEAGHSVESLLGIDMPESPFVNMLFGWLEPLLQHLLVVAPLPVTESVAELLIEVFLLLHKLVNQNKFRQFFDQHSRSIIVEVCLVFMRVQPSDLEELQDNPDDFVHQAIDLCEGRESEDYRTAASQLFEAVCENIDGALPFAAHFCSELVNYALTQNTEGYQYLPQYAGHCIVTAPAESCAEIGLVGLSVLWYPVGKRRDLLEMLEGMLVQHWDKLTTVTSLLIQQRLCLFIQFYTQFLFPMDPLWLTSLTQLVISYCTPEPEPSVRSIQATFTIRHFFSEELVAVRLIEVLPRIFDQVITLIPSQDSPQFFDALQEIVSTNVGVAVTHAQVLTAALAAKLHSLATRSLRDHGVVLKCWNIIKFLSTHVPTDSLLAMEQVLLPVFEFIQQPELIAFDGEILAFEVTLMKRCQAVTPAAWTLFSQFARVQDKYEGTFGPLFSVLNCLLYFGKDSVSPSALQVIVQLSTRCLFAVPKNRSNEAANAEGALILQQVLHAFSNLTHDLLEAVYTAVFRRLQTPISNRFFVDRLLGVFLAGWSSDEGRTTTLLNSLTTPANVSYLQVVLESVFERAVTLNHNYDRKVFALGLTALLSRGNYTGLFASVFPVLVQVLASYEEEVEVPSFMQEATQVVISKFHASRDEIEASLSLAKSLTILEAVDEFDSFRNSLRGLQAQGILAFLVHGLDQTQVNLLGKVVKSQKVQVANASATEVRRVVKAKKCK